MNHEDHESLEGHETLEAEDLSPLAPFRMRVQSPLSPEAERIMTETIGCAIAVHRALGPGFLESIYRKAMRVELEARRLAFESERPVTINYRGFEITGQRVDLIIERVIVVELKSVVRLDEVHRAHDFVPENDGTARWPSDQFPRVDFEPRAAQSRVVIG